MGTGADDPRRPTGGPPLHAEANTLSEIMRGSRVGPRASFVTYGKGHALFAWTATPVYQG